MAGESVTVSVRFNASVLSALQCSKRVVELIEELGRVKDDLKNLKADQLLTLDFSLRLGHSKDLQDLLSSTRPGQTQGALTETSTGISSSAVSPAAVSPTAPVQPITPASNLTKALLASSSSSSGASPNTRLSLAQRSPSASPSTADSSSLRRSPRKRQATSSSEAAEKKKRKPSSEAAEGAEKAPKQQQKSIRKPMEHNVVFMGLKGDKMELGVEVKKSCIREMVEGPIREGLQDKDSREAFKGYFSKTIWRGPRGNDVLLKEEALALLDAEKNADALENRAVVIGQFNGLPSIPACGLCAEPVTDLKCIALGRQYKEDRFSNKICEKHAYHSECAGVLLWLGDHGGKCKSPRCLECWVEHCIQSGSATKHSPVADLNRQPSSSSGSS